MTLNQLNNFTQKRLREKIDDSYSALLGMVVGSLAVVQPVEGKFIWLRLFSETHYNLLSLQLCTSCIFWDCPDEASEW